MVKMRVEGLTAANSVSNTSLSTLGVMYFMLSPCSSSLPQYLTFRLMAEPSQLQNGTILAFNKSKQVCHHHLSKSDFFM